MTQKTADETCFEFDGVNCRVNKAGSRTEIQGRMPDGGSYTFQSEGDPHATLQLTHPDGSSSEQKFDYHDNAMLTLPDGKKLLFRTQATDASGRATEQGRVTLVSADNSRALRVDHAGAQGGALGLHLDHIAPGGIWDYVKQVEGGGPCQSFQLDNRGVTNEFGQRANSTNVRAQEAFNRDNPDVAARDLACGLMGSGLRFEGCDNLFGLSAMIQAQQGLGGGHVCGRGPDGQAVFCRVPGMGHRDREDREDAWGDFGPPPFPPFAPPPFGLRTRDAAAYLQLDLASQGRNFISFDELREDAQAAQAGSWSYRDLAAQQLMRHPRQMHWLDRHNDGFQDGGLTLDDLGRLAGQESFEPYDTPYPGVVFA